MTTILSPNKHKGRVRPIRLIVEHTMEVAEVNSAAESVARAFQNPARKASAHVCVDPDSEVRCVPDEDTAWAAPGANADGLQLEMAGYAGQTTGDWADDASKAILERAAQRTAAWCKEHGIPVRRLTVAQIRDGVSKGIAGHADITEAFPDKGNGHWDPGPSFPWDAFLARVAQLVGGTTPAAPAPAKPAPAKPAPRPDCTGLQRAVRTTVDNRWGSDTDMHCDALREASDWGGNDFPYGVAFTQGVVGTTRDGKWGPKSNAAHDATVAAVQRALKAMGFNPGVIDGRWGPKSEAAYQAARRACHI